VGHNARDIITARQEEHAAQEGFPVLDENDLFPAFTRRFTLYQYPRDFKPVDITKYDGKTSVPQQWLRC
jgi:hypothetical protein